MAEVFDLVCVCGMKETVSVSEFTQLYRAMNELGWGLIPSQHGRTVTGVCQACRNARALEKLNGL